ncbi:MAG: DUF488 family protein [Thermofilaceae archaeon]
MRAYTLGYGGVKPERFLEIVGRLGCRVVVDVRRFPRSSVSFYTGENLRAELERIGVSYVWLGELGALGLSKRYRVAEPVTCTSSPTFQSYVVYLTTEPQALRALSLIRGMAVEGLAPLIICREGKPEYCHRQFIADALTAMNVEVVHIIGEKSVKHTGSPCYSYVAAKLASSVYMKNTSTSA